MLGRGKVTVARARAWEFGVPSPSRPQHRRLSTRIVAIRLDAAIRERHVAGFGESGAYRRRSAPRTWRFLRDVLRQLEGTTLSTRPKPARDQVATVVARLRDGVGSSADRQVLLGVEMALLDLAARGAGVPVAVLLEGRTIGRTAGRPGRTATTHAIRMTQPIRDIRRKIAHGGPSLLRLSDISDHDSGQSALALAAEAMRSNEPEVRSLWLDLGAGFDLFDTQKLVHSVADRIRAGDLPTEVIVRYAAGTAEPAEFGKAQAEADSLMPPTEEHAGIILMGEPVHSVSDAEALVEAGMRGITIDPHLAGGLLPTYEIAGQIRQRQPQLRIGLDVRAAVSDVTVRALSQLATTVERLDYLCLSPAEVGLFAVEDVPDSAGMGIVASLAPAVEHLTRSIAAPREQSPPLSSGRLRANEYDFTKFAGVNMPSSSIGRAMLAAGLNTQRLSSYCVLGTHPDLPHPFGFATTTSTWTSGAAQVVIASKGRTRDLLQAADIAVPPGRTFAADNVDEAVAFAASLAGPVVVKPKMGTKGKGVFTRLTTENEVRAAITALGQTSYQGKDFIVERYLTGHDYRFLVVGNRVVSVTQRLPASVIGDGRSTIVELVLAKNLIKLGHRRLIKLRAEAMHWLRWQGLTVDSVPEQGQVVRLSGAANSSLGADTIEVLDETHESLLDLAVRATRTIPGLDEAGIDLIIDDHRRTLDEQDAAILELNQPPGLSLHLFPLFGPSRDVAAELVRRSCELAGWPVGPPADTARVRIRVDGDFVGPAYCQWLGRQARNAKLVGSVRRLSSGSVEALVSGPLVDVSWLTARAFRNYAQTSITHVTTSHVDSVIPTDRFEVHA